MGNTPDTHVTGPVGYCAHVRNVRVVEIETSRVAPEVQLMAIRQQADALIRIGHQVLRLCNEGLNAR